MQLKVDRERLIAAIEKRLEQIKSEYRKECEAYPPKAKAYGAKVAAALEKLAERVREGELSSIRSVYNGTAEIRLFIGEIPTKPSYPNSIQKIELRLKKLRLSSQPNIALNEKDECLEYL